MAFSLPDSLPVLETSLKRFTLSPLTENHYDALGAIFLNKKLWSKGYGDGEFHPLSSVGMEKYISDHFAKYRVFAVMTNPDYFDDCRLAGTTGITQVVAPDARVRIGRTTLDPDLWGTGANYEIKLTFLDWLFSHGAERVEALVDDANEQSSNSLVKFGFSHEGSMRKFSRRLDGTWKDISLFSLLSEEWPDVKNRNIERIFNYKSPAYITS